MSARESLLTFRRPDEEDERRALIWLTDVRAYGCPLECRYAASIIDTLAWFEQEQKANSLLRGDSQRKEGDTFRQITVSEAISEWRVDVDGHGDWYVIKGPRVVSQCPNWKELGHE